MSAAFALDFSGPPVPCDYPQCVLDAYHEGDHQIGVEVVERHFREAGVPTKRDKNGDLLVQCSDATFDYLTGNRKPYVAPLLCSCPQREYPHDLSIHGLIRSEWWSKERRTQWPWSLMASLREEPSTERKAA
jgi:hypothetical protein